MKQFYVQENEAGQRFDKLLSKILNKAPKSFLYKMLRKKNITLNGKKAEGSEKLALNDEITLFLSDDTIKEFSEPVTMPVVDTVSAELKFDIIYEDKHIMVVNKPLGVLSQKAEKDDVSMVEYIISYLLKSKQLTKEQMVSFKPAICNRLDRNTGGILIAGKSLLGLQEMARLLKDRSLNKYYLCIVKGKVEGRKRIEGFLSKDEEKNQVKIYPTQKENTEYICTEYEPVAYSKNANKDETAVKEEAYLRNLKRTTWENNTQNASELKQEEDTEGIFTLLQVKLITGRSHQIRAHLASIGHPIVGEIIILRESTG
jgi:23S rRNA pseudouridine955/2504/2580 synthase